MSFIKNNLDKINKKITSAANQSSRNPSEITLIAVSKRKPIQAINQAIEAGATNFGENYIQEAIEKIESIGNDSVTWHFIGHLQSNKAKLAVKYFDYIHTVDSIKLANQLNNQAAKIDKIQKVLIQVNIGNENTKSGTSHEAALSLAEQVSQLDHLSLEGLMCMPPYSIDPEAARPFFKDLAALKETIIKTINPVSGLKHLSMGMSNDFHVAIQEGATMIRVGTSIFGERE